MSSDGHLLHERFSFLDDLPEYDGPPLSDMMVELLDVLVHSSTSIQSSDAMWHIGTRGSPQGIGRTMGALSRRGLAWHDISDCGNECLGRYVYVASQAGERWIRHNWQRVLDVRRERMG